MLNTPRWGLAFGLVLLALFMLPAQAAGHAALKRSEPPAGAELSAPPEDIRIWFTEPLEKTYSGAELLDATGNPVSNVEAKVAPDNAHQLLISIPPDLPDGAYTVAWRTLSSADGHTLDGYFGFSIGVTAGDVVAGTNAAGSDIPRQISRGLALLGLAALAALAPLTLGLFDPLARAVPDLRERLAHLMRRYALFAALFALLGSVAALAAQAAAIAPESSLFGAMAQTLGETRYGQLWLLRLLLLAATIALIGAALRGRERWRKAMLWAATATSLLSPIPYSLLSHAAAQEEGRSAALAADVLHLLAASLWAGGLFMLALILLPALLTATPIDRGAALRVAVPRFSVLGVAAWAILLLSGIYASWLQVGTLAALRQTDYGHALLLKGILLLPVLALAAFHLILGWRGVAIGDARRLMRTLAIEASIVVVVLLVVGRLIGLEPAREALAGQSPSGLSLPLAFAASADQQRGTLSISPGVVGNNTFSLTIEGAALPEGSEAVLRFAMPSRAIGQQELPLPESGPNQFQAEGSELAVAGDWQVTAIVRKIGSYSWRGSAPLTIGVEPPAAGQPNPAPHFGSGGALGMIALAVGLAVVVAAVLAPGPALTRRGTVAACGIVATVGGIALLGAARLPAVASPPTPQGIAVGTPSAATPSVPEPSDLAHAHHRPAATPTSAELPTVGTPVAADGFSASLRVDPLVAGSVDVTVALTADDGAPLTGARVVVLASMAGMASDQPRTPAKEVAPGRYLTDDVALSMAGEWQLAVRVSPKGASTQILHFTLAVP